MTNKVLHVIIGITMQGISTVTQKGQVTIPKVVRDKLGMKPSDKILFELQGSTFIGRPAPTLESLYGMFHVVGKKPLTKKQMKKIISDAVVEKYNKKLAQSRA